MRKIKAASNPAKATAWKTFAKYIKTRDALNTTGTTLACRCFTCNRIEPIERIDAGHAIPGRTEGILFDEELVYGQCQTCNRLKGGEEQAFRIILTDRYGEDWWNMKQFNKRAVLQRTDDDYREITRKYRLMTEELLEGEGKF